MADLSKEFAEEQDLGASFAQEQDLETPVQEVAAEPKISTGQSAATGFHRGMMLGGAEELAGLGAGIGEKVTDTDTFQKLADWYQGYKTNASPEAMAIAAEGQAAPGKSFGEAYRQGQQEAQAVTNEARTAHPLAFGASQVAGGIIPGLATGGLAAAAPIKTAAAVGALTGGLESEANIENDPTQLATDVLKGGVIGGILGKFLPGGAKKSASSADDILKQGEFIPQLKAAAKMGEEGVSLGTSPEARKVLTERLQAGEKEIAGKFIDPRKKLGEAISTPLKQPGLELSVTPDDITAFKNIEDTLLGNIKTIGRGKAEELARKAQALQQGLLSPEETYQFRKELGSILSKVPDATDQQILKTGSETIKNVLEETSPGFKKGLTEFAQFAEKGPEALLSKGFDPEIADVFLGDLSKGNLKITEKVRDLLRGVRAGGEEGLKKQGELFNTIRQLETLAKENPELVKKLGIDPQNLLKEIISKADEAAVAGKVAGEGVAQAAYERGKFGLRKASEAGALKAANLYGGAKRAIGQSKIGRSVKSFVSETKEDLASAADDLQNLGGEQFSHLAEGLRSEIPQKRNAAIFSILQLPKAKEILGINEGEE